MADTFTRMLKDLAEDETVTFKCYKNEQGVDVFSIEVTIHLRGRMRGNLSKEFCASSLDISNADEMAALVSQLREECFRNLLDH